MLEELSVSLTVHYGEDPWMFAPGFPQTPLHALFFFDNFTLCLFNILSELSCENKGSWVI